jgi:hypothetical protein
MLCEGVVTLGSGTLRAGTRVQDAAVVAAEEAQQMVERRRRAARALVAAMYWLGYR